MRTKKRYGIGIAIVWMLITAVVIGSLFFLQELEGLFIFVIGFFGLLALLNAIGALINITVVDVGEGRVLFRQGRGVRKEIPLGNIKRVECRFEMPQTDKGNHYKDFNFIVYTYDDEFWLKLTSVRPMADIATLLESRTSCEVTIETEFENIEAK